MERDKRKRPPYPDEDAAEEEPKAMPESPGGASHDIAAGMWGCRTTEKSTGKKKVRRSSPSPQLLPTHWTLRH
jgi:hypothetical protein